MWLACGDSREADDDEIYLGKILVLPCIDGYA